MHDVHELVLLLVQVVTLLRDLLLCVSWGAGKAPLAIEVLVISELELELLQDAIDFHAGSDLVLKLIDLVGGSRHLISDTGQVLDVLRGALNGQIELVKGIHGRIGHLLGTLGNELDNLIGNLRVLVSDDVTNATAVHIEHRYHL